MNLSELLPNLPDAARVWIMGLLRPVSESERKPLQESLRAFWQEWKSHGAEVTGEGELVYDRFIVLAADEAKTQVSGCSIDGMNRQVGQVAAKLRLPVGDHSFVFYRTGARGEIVAVSRDEFAELAAAGKVHSGTVVFNNAVQTLREIRSGKWELPLRESWHAEAFDLEGGEAHAN